MSAAEQQEQLRERPRLDKERQKQARNYSVIRRKLSIAETAFSLIVILVILFTGFSSFLMDAVKLPVVSEAVIYFLILVATFEIISSPISYYSGYILPKRYGVSTQKFKQWLLDVLKGAAISLVLGTAAIAMAYWLLLTFPDIWWLLGWLLMLIITVVLSLLAPVLLVPLFYKVKPMPDSELKKRLEKLTEKTRAKVQGIYMLDFSSKGTTANAGLMGIGKTRRIVVSDTLIDQYTPAEIEVIVAHEIGHHLHRDMMRLFVVQSAVYLLVFWLVDLIFKALVPIFGFGGITDTAALPLLALIFGVLTGVASPLLSSYSRKAEKQADAYSITVSGDAEAFIDAMTRLVNQNLAVADPPKWEEFLFHDHPSYNKRVEMAEGYKKENI